MKKLLSNRGNMLFLTIVSLAVAMLCFSTISLVASVKMRVNKHSSALYDAYTYEAYCKIITDETLKVLGDIEAAVYYTPLANSADLQSQLQEAILNKYSEHIHTANLIPESITTEVVKFEVSTDNLDIVLDDNLDLRHTELMKLPPVTLYVTIDNMRYNTEISGVRLIYSFNNNQILCKYNLEQITKSVSGLYFV